MHLHWIIVTFIIMVTSCVALWLHKKNEKKMKIYHFIDYHLRSLIFYRNGFKQLGDKIGIQTRIVSFTESCCTVTPGNQCCQLHKNAIPSVFPQFPKHLQKTESKRKSPVKRKFVESKRNTFEPSPSKVKKSVNTEHAYISNETPDAKN